MGNPAGVVEVKWIEKGWWLEIEHDGSIDWDAMQQIKNEWFGENVTCYEVYPKSSDVINCGNYRHLWRAPNMADYC